MTKRVNRDDLEKFHDFGIHVPTRTIELFGEINSESAEKFIKNFHILDTTSGPIKILLNTEGGDMSHGMAIYDTIKGSSNHVTILVVGEAYSMGSVILQAADHRQITSHSSVMFHRGEITVGNTPQSEVRSSFDFDEKYAQSIDDILYPLVNASRTFNRTLTREKFNELNNRATYLRGIEAVEWGLVDEVV